MNFGMHFYQPIRWQTQVHCNQKDEATHLPIPLVLMYTEQKDSCISYGGVSPGKCSLKNQKWLVAWITFPKKWLVRKSDPFH